MTTRELIQPYLLDFKGNDVVFENVFLQNRNLGSPIEHVLELGLHHGERPIYGGQSTKAFYSIYNTVGYAKLYSMDLGIVCAETIDIISDMFRSNNFACPPHDFIVCNSIEYTTNQDFDFVFLDTNHDSDAAPPYEGKEQTCGGGFTYREIVKYSQMLSENGRFFLHDTKNFYQPRVLGSNVEGAAVKFIRENSDWAFIEHNTNEHGLGELININSDIYKYLQSSEEKYRNWKELSFNQIDAKY